MLERKFGALGIPTVTILTILGCRVTHPITALEFYVFTIWPSIAQNLPCRVFVIFNMYTAAFTMESRAAIDIL